MSEESVLTKEQVVKAMNLFINETKGKVFCLMTDEEIRVAYLQMELGIVVEPKSAESDEEC